MHELGIATDFWAVIKQEAKKAGLKRVTKIIIVLGEASGIEEGFLTHSLKGHVLPGTFAEGAELVFIQAKLAAKCNSCEKEISKNSMTDMNCPHCASCDIEIVSGKETYVQSIEGE